MQSNPCPWDEKASSCSSGKNQRVSRLGSCLALETDGECEKQGRRSTVPPVPGAGSLMGEGPAPHLSPGSLIS